MKTHLVFGLITALLLVIVIGSRRQEAFTFEDVRVMAESMAHEGYLSAAPLLPRSLRDLSPGEQAAIRWRDERTLWRSDGLPFQVRFIHPGAGYDRSIEVYEINRARPERVRYSPAFFDFGGTVITEPLPDWLGYAGFRLHHPLNRPDALDEVLSFPGDSRFRLVAKDLVYGATTRPLLIDPGTPWEEVPVFTRVWLKRPDAFSKVFSFYALMESPGVCGAYQFDYEPGAESRLHVRAVLYFRRAVQVAGIAPLESMFWFGENTSNTFGDLRPEVHKSDGLLVQRSAGEWVWRPLTWSAEPQINVFSDNGPKGFGLLQRDRDFNHYQDLREVFHKMPSLWVQPLRGFDRGAIHLIQKPVRNGESDNVLACWAPGSPPIPLQPVEIEYTVRVVSAASDLPPLGRCESTRVDLQEFSNRRHFFLDFADGPLDRLKPGALPSLDVTSPTGADITERTIERNDFNKSWRASFVASSNDPGRPAEIFCRLTDADAPLTETWSYTWRP